MDVYKISFNSISLIVLLSSSLLLSTGFALSPSPSVSPSASRTPLPGTIEIYWEDSRVYQFKDGSPLNYFIRACVGAWSRNRHSTGIFIDQSFNVCMMQCLSILSGKFCNRYNSTTWAHGPPRSPSCAISCGANPQRTELKVIHDGRPVSFTVYVVPSTTPSPSSSPSPSISSTPAPIFGLPRFSSEDDLPVFDEDQGPEENSEHTTDNLEFYVYTGLTRRNASAGIRSSFSITQFSDPSNRQLHVARSDLNLSARSVAQCSHGRCATRVRVWSDNKIGKRVVSRAVAKLRGRQGFRNVYTIFWDKIKRRRQSPREWSVEIPFSKSYQRRYAGNAD